MTTTDQDTPKAPRGFAALAEDRRRAIAQRGGKAAHAAGRAHRFTSEEAAAASRKGVAARRAKATHPNGDT
jgi:hypothetical protein